MDYDYQHGPQDGHAGEGVELEGDQPHHRYEQEGDDEYYEEIPRREERIDPPRGGDEFDRKASRDSSSAGKLFVGGLSWETSEDAFANYFSKFGEITDSVIMTDRQSGRPRGFGFVTYADVAVADRVIEQDHIIDGRAVEVKRTVPREDAGGKGVKRTKKIFVGGIPPSFTEEELKEHFSVYGGIIEHQIMLDHKTGRSRGFGFVTFESEESVEQIFSEGKMHDLGGKRVEIKKAEPKRPGGDYGSSKSQGGYSSGAGSYGAGNMSGSRYVGKVGNGFGGYGNYGAYNGYDNYGGGYAGGSSSFYGAYGGGAGYGYGFGYGGPMMYGGVGSGYGGNNFNGPSGYGRAGSGYGGGRGYGRSEGGSFSTGRGYGGSGYANGGAVSGGYGGGKGYGGGATGGGASSGRFHPYRK